MNKIRQFFRRLTPDAWIRIGLWALYSLIFIIGVHSCAHSGAGGSNVGNGIWVLMGMGLIVAAVMTRDHVRLPWIFSTMALLIIIILLGKFDTFFGWGVIGLPAFAAAGIWGYTRTEGRARAFLGFASGVVILAWLFLFIQGNIHPKLSFLGDRLSNPINLIIFFLAVALFIFATWKKSKIFYLISFVVLASWIGNSVFVRIGERYPKSLKPPSLPTSVSTNKVVGALGEYIESLVTRFNASANREAVTARRDSLERKTWEIKPGTRIYDCPSGTSCILTTKKYNTKTKVFSLGDSVEINSITYEKCALPDLKTNQPGKIIGWIMSTNLVESATTKNLQKGVLVAVIAKSNNRFANVVPGRKPLGPGKYYQIPAGRTSFQFAGEKSPRTVGDGRSFTILPGQKVLGVRTRHPSVRIYQIK